MIDEFGTYNTNTDVYDPWVNKEEAKNEYNLSLVQEPVEGKYDAIILAVAHKEFLDLGIESIRAFGKPNCILFDIKSVLPKQDIDARL
jgi:UDP-N-acetyl-D-galactosamine dehydrogenase